MTDFTVIPYEKENGEAPVEEFLNSLNENESQDVWHDWDIAGKRKSAQRTIQQTS